MGPVEHQTILITGSTDGIGKLAAIKFAEQNAKVLVHGRNKEKLNKVVDEIKSTTNNKKIEGLLADFSCLDEVSRLAGEINEKYPRLDVLVNNAGVGFADPRYSEDGYELRLAVNYLAPFIFTRLLLPSLKNAAPSKIVNVSSLGQYPIQFDDIILENNFDASKAYSQSKLALIMFSFDLADELKNANITVNTLHPGTYLNTNMVRNAGINPLGEAKGGADAIVYLATSEKLDGITGRYFNVTKEAQANQQAYDKEARKRLKELTLEFFK